MKFAFTKPWKILSLLFSNSGLKIFKSPSIQQMKSARLTSLLREISPFRSPNGFTSNFYSTKARPGRRFSRLWESSTIELYRRISPVGDPNVSIVPILDQWIEEGRSVTQGSLIDIIKELRSYKRYHHALEISMWMTDKRYHFLASSDVAIRLDLISKTQGIEQAEKYFNNVPQKLKGLEVYGALLNCYATARCVGKAEAVMQKMRDLGFAKTALVHNVMLTLYYKTRNMEKFDVLLQEMEGNGVVRNGFTLAIQISACAAVMDIERMDKVVTLMGSDPKFVPDWTNYTSAAAAYTKAGLLDKASRMLKNAEARVTSKPPVSIAYNHLLTQYAIIGKKDEVLRVWSLYKKKCKVYNEGYKNVLYSLVKLSDIEMAQRILDEWESLDLTYDIQIPNILIGAYSSMGQFEKAEALINRATSRGEQPNAWTWYYLATGYLKINQPQKAVEMMKRAIVRTEPLWKPSITCLAACLEHLKGVGGMEEAEEFMKLLLNKSVISIDIQEKLLNASKAEKSNQNCAMEPVREDRIQI